MNTYTLSKGLTFLFCAMFVFSSSFLTAQTSIVTDPYITFETPLHDFGTVKKGEVKTHIFKFTNTGKEDIKIDFVTVGCECTELEWPETKTFKPGESGEIKVIYDSGKEEELGEHDKYFEVVLVNKDPEKGYQIIKEADFKVVVVE
ncbi:MAG: hypothetical protein ACI956_001217 [Nonlabens sp.]|jgi:hypothetical protein